MKRRVQDHLKMLAQPGLRPRSLSSGWGRNLSGAIALAGALVILPACSNSSPTTETSESSDYESEVEETTEPLEGAAESPEDYLGEIVTLSGEIQRLYDKNAFVLRDEEYFEPEATILVVNANPMGLELNEGAYVQVTGEINQFVLADIEQEYDVTLDDELVKEIEADFAEEPVVVATSVFEAQLPD